MIMAVLYPCLVANRVTAGLYCSFLAVLFHSDLRLEYLPASGLWHIPLDPA